MTSDKLKEVLKAVPFNPFRLHLADGRPIDVSHPELMAVSPSGRIAYVFKENDTHDSGHHIDVLMITDIEVRQSRNGNGKHRRKAG
jgi:hypothetical protein